jgi:cell shape-determining protein MreD
MIRAFAYVVLGWLLLAVVGGLAEVLELTVMLPATSAVVITHVAFARSPSLPVGLAVGIALGYLEDLHQGAPVGTLTLAYGIAFLALRWFSGRFHIGGLTMRAMASLGAVILIDLLTLAILAALAEPLGLRREALWSSVSAARWHALATLLVAPPVWALLDRAFAVMRLEEATPDHMVWSQRK